MTTTTKAKQCTGKNAHKYKDKAQDEMFGLARTWATPITRYRVYKCKFCNSYHVGHSYTSKQTRRDRRRR